MNELNEAQIYLLEILNKEIEKHGKLQDDSQR